MTRILVAIDGTERGERALAWAARVAARDGAELELLAVVDPALARTYGVDREQGDAASARVLDAARESVLAEHPETLVETRVVFGKIVDSIVDAAAACDLVVLGSHHGSTVGETIGGAKGLRVSVSVDVPTVVVPCDWDPAAEAHRVVVGVGPDDSHEAAVAFGAREALSDGEPLELVSAWGLPPLLAKPAEALGGGWEPMGEQFQLVLDGLVERLRGDYPDLAVSGRAIEGPSPSRVLIDCAADCKLLVLGTHSRSALGRTLFGSVTHSVLLNLRVPTAIVPQK